MARPNQFDQEIKSKVYSHQAEPSARVWAGVREVIPARTPSRKIIFLRFSAVLILFSLAGGAWWYFGSDNGTTDGGKQLTEQNHNPAPPSDWAGSTSTAPASDASPVAVEPVEAPSEELIREEATAWNAPTANTSQPSRKATANNDNTSQPAQKNTSETVADPVLEARLPINEDPELVVPVEIVTPTPTPAPVPTLQEVIAEEEQQVKEGMVEEVKEVQGEAAQSRKRRIDLKNLDFQEVKAQTGSAIGNLAQEAGEKIGIHTEREQTDKKKKFSANFGALKIKRVKNK